MILDIISGHFFPGEIVFLLLCAAGGWMIGKSVASDWKGLGSMVFFTLLLGLGARFLHFALYEAVFVSPTRYLVDTAVFLVVAYIGYRYTRTNQMTRQYHWLYEKASPISWKDRS
jgi:small-conductance mechanosensitive channel